LDEGSTFEHRMLTMAVEFRSAAGFRISPTDPLGRAIEPAVLDAAEEIGQRAVHYAEKLVGDPALATNLLEESAAAVSRVLRSQQAHNNIRVHDLRAYLFRAFIRRVNKVRRRQLVIGERNPTPPKGSSVSSDLETQILVGEFLTRCDPVTRDMFYRRSQGFSWKEIGRVYGISAHAAESRFSQTLQKVRRRLGLK
jgi:DNA-directed RNA polymerase specialized sigma24 family protein